MKTIKDLSILGAMLAATFAFLSLETTSGELHLIESRPVRTITTPVSAPAFGFTLPGKIDQHVDGDTMFVELRLRVKVRFSELDSPEMKTEAGRRAAEALVAKSPVGSDCVVWLKGPDTSGEIIGNAWSFERWVGRVWIKGEKQSLGNWQIKQGNVK